MIKRAVKTYFGDIRDGRLQRLNFFWYSVLAVAVFILFGILVVASIGALESFIGGDLMEAQNQIRKQFGVPATIIVMIFGATLFFANLNISAKRARDSGLPGWLSILIFVFVSAFLSRMGFDTITSLLSLAATLWLLFARSDILKGK